jgi:chloride channel 3/4/5
MSVRLESPYMVFASKFPLYLLQVALANRDSPKKRWGMVFTLLMATLIRIFFVIISYGCKVPAGIFVPSMAIGASFGRMIGILVQALQEAYPQSAFFSSCQPDVPCITPGTYAFLGAAAALSGIMHITVSVVVIMFEVTGALTYILPTMVCKLLLLRTWC